MSVQTDNVEFEYFGKKLRYFDNEYNTTRLNERAVEIAIAKDFVERNALSLEVGNVLGYYNVFAKKVIDRYEEGEDVENTDIFGIKGVYKSIVSISTVEHVGLDEDREDGKSAIDALEYLISRKSKNGSLLVTVPAGYNPKLDSYLKKGSIAPKECTFVRDGGLNWIQTEDLIFEPYGKTTQWAESVWIGEW